MAREEPESPVACQRVNLEFKAEIGPESLRTIYLGLIPQFWPLINQEAHDPRRRFASPPLVSREYLRSTAEQHPVSGDPFQL